MLYRFYIYTSYATFPLPCPIGITVGKINLALIVLASIDQTVGATSSGLVLLSSPLRADFRPHKFCEI